MNTFYQHQACYVLLHIAVTPRVYKRSTPVNLDQK